MTSIDFEQLVHETIISIEEADLGERRVFEENEINRLFEVKRQVGLFSEQTTCFALFIDPAQVRDSTGILLVSQTGKGAASHFYIQGAAKLPPLFLRQLRTLILSGGEFLRHFCASNVPVHLILDVTRLPEEMDELKAILGNPQPNIHEHMLEKSLAAKGKHVIGAETISAFGIHFHSAFGGKFEAYKTATISKEFMVRAVKLLISQDRLHMDWDLRGAVELRDQMKAFKGKITSTNRGKKYSFSSQHDDLVDAMLMLGYWGYLRLIQGV